MDLDYTPSITLFHCINTLDEGDILFSGGEEKYHLKSIKLPCSGMVKDVFLLRAFEAGADAVIVLVCPEDQCRHVEGSIRAKKRIEWTQDLLDKIGLDGRRLAIFNMSSGDETAGAEIIRKIIRGLDDLGPNPAV